MESISLRHFIKVLGTFVAAPVAWLHGVRRSADFSERPPGTDTRAKNEPIRILLVDDARACRLILAHFLRRIGGSHFNRVFEIVEAGDGLDAIKVLIDDGPFDLVCTNLQMPYLDGDELIKKIRAGISDHAGVQKPTSRTVPIILNSGRTGDAVRQSAMEAGADIFLECPIHMEEMVAAIQSLLSLDCNAANALA